MPASRYKSLEITDRKVEKSRLNQLIDIIASDISTDTNRRTYPAFVTGLTTPITSSLFQTIFDQNHTYQSSNAMLDMTFGIYANVSGSIISGSSLVTELNPSIDSSGKLIFSSSTSLMMREKINIYKQYAQTLLGDANSSFFAPFESTTESDRVNEALFINIKRLFKRDNIYKGSFGIKMFDTLLSVSGPGSNLNLFNTSNDSSPVMIIDKDGSTNYRLGYAGEVGSLWRTTDSGDSYDVSPCGLIFYDAGIIVLNVAKLNNTIMNSLISGVISFPDTAASNGNIAFPSGHSQGVGAGFKALGANGDTTNNTFKAFLKLASIDDIIKHFCKARFPTTATTAIAFQNETIINSTIFYCNASPDEFNYSTNPTYTDNLGKIQVVDDENDTPFSYITTVGLYNAAGELLAVAKLSRPIEKNPTHNLSVRVRLDY